MRSAIAAAAAALLLAWAPAARAHQWWLEPSRYAPGPTDTVTCTAHAGMGFRGERKAYVDGRVRREVLVADGAAHPRAPSGIAGRDVFARVPASALGRGAALLALETGFAHIVLGPGEFDRYLAEEGLDGPLAARRHGASRDSVAERYARCAKVWLQGGAGAAVPAGLTLELVPLGPLSADGRLELRVLLRGRPLAGALVRAWRCGLDAAGAPQAADARDSVAVADAARSDGAGRVRLRLAGAGEWMLATVHMERSGDPADADWQSFWASLTFARPLR